MPEESTVPEVSWREVSGNRFNVALSVGPAMNVPIKRLVNIRLIGESRNAPPKLRSVVYDREYVIAKIANDFIKPLGALTYNEIQQLFTQAYRSWKDEK